MNIDTGTGEATYPISGVLRLRNPFSLRLILFGCAPACCCCCCCFCCSSKSCSCCWLSSSCWNLRLPLLVSFSLSFGSTNSSCERLWRHQKYAAASRMSSKTIMPRVERTPINIMRPRSAVNVEEKWISMKISMAFSCGVVDFNWSFKISSRKSLEIHANAQKIKYDRWKQDQ